MRRSKYRKESADLEISRDIRSGALGRRDNQEYTFYVSTGSMRDVIWVVICCVAKDVVGCLGVGCEVILST